MNILGIGGWELLAILLIMLLVAGPKRMIHWAYIMGQYIAKFRAMWSETVDVIQKEFDDAGVGIQIPKDIPTRGNLNQQIGKAMESMTRPVKETMDKATTEMNQIKTTTAAAATTANSAVKSNGAATKEKTATAAPPKPKTSTPSASKPKTFTPPAAAKKMQPPPAKDKPDFGTWSGQTNNNKPDFGTWSGKKKDDQGNS
jgi:Sec-independent protein translocase protein TatA